jgi:hypothetical protein
MEPLSYLYPQKVLSDAIRKVLKMYGVSSDPSTRAKMSR